MNKQFIDKIVRDTLEGIPYKFTITEADVALVLAAFLDGTNMYKTDEVAHKRYGMMAMSHEQMEKVIHDLIIPHDEMYQYVLTYTMVDCRNFEYEDVWLAAEYNLAFQVILTYLYLFHRNGGRPESVIEAIDVYMDYWDRASTKNTKANIGYMVSQYSRPSGSLTRSM